ncbi:MAG: hypothetical protein Q7T10_20320 [Rhodoferax sp.]|nr:hypothetical protein [Rhodoferax sp.]MDO8451146.1 hypothetical protein [Rhodoferax sp.]
MGVPLSGSFFVRKVGTVRRIDRRLDAEGRVRTWLSEVPVLILR